MNLSIEKKKLDKQKAETAKMELQYKILKIKEEIKRIEDHIGLQDDIINRLKEELDV